MKILTLIVSSASVLMLLSTLICGLWLRSKGADPEGVAFHIRIAISSVVITLIGLGLLVYQVVKG
jgi:hypothetical protein